MTTTSSEDWVETNEPAVKLFTKIWHPASRPIATVIFNHGFGEHIVRYDELFHLLCSNDIKVGAFDRRGFGQTGRASRQRGRAGSLEQTLQDIQKISDMVRIDGIPHFIMGQGMGGFLALYYSSKNQSEFTGVIGCSPLCGIKVKPSMIERFLLKRVAPRIPNLCLHIPLNDKNLSHDKNVRKAYNKDPLVHYRGSLELASTLVFMPPSLEREHASDFKLPLLILSGSLDENCDPNASKRFLEKCASSDKTFFMVEGAFHEVQNELPEMKDQAFKAYLEWIKSRALSASATAKL